MTVAKVGVESVIRAGQAAGGRGAGVEVPGGDGVALGLLSSSTFVGLHWQSVAAGGSGFAGSAPIAGKVELEGLIVGPQRVPAAEDPHRFQLGLASDVPASQAAMDAAEQLFARVSQADDSRFDLVVAWGDAGLFVPIGPVLAVNGRRIVGRWYNGATGAGDAWVGVTLHKVVGGAGQPDPGFLSGERVQDG